MSVTTTGAPYQPASGGGPTLPSLPPSPYTSGQSESPAPPLTGDTSNNSGFAGLFRTLKRRQGIFIFTTALISSLLALNTLRERRFNPVFAGDFILQIESALPEEPVLDAPGKIGALANARQKPNSIPTLRAILRSPLVIAPVAERMGLQTSDIISKLDVVGGDNTTSVLRVSLTWSNPEQGRLLLENIAREYVKFSISQRQSSIDAGMKWLDAQAPEILAKVSRYENQLKRFRESNLVIDPSENAAAIIAQRDALVGQVSVLQMQQVQIQNQIQIGRAHV